MTQWGIEALFNPGKRHMDEEKRRLQSTRQEIGDSSGGKRIDLGSGKVKLPSKPKPDTAADSQPDSADSQSDSADTQSEAAAQSDEDVQTGEEPQTGDESAQSADKQA